MTLNSLKTTGERKEKGGKRGEKKKGLLALIIFIFLNDKKVLAHTSSDTATKQNRFQKSRWIYINNSWYTCTGKHVQLWTNF